MKQTVSATSDGTGSHFMGTTWVAVDWGTSHLRLWCLNAQGDVVHKIEDPRGMSKLSQSEFEPVLVELLAPVFEFLPRVSVVCCGMCGSRQGWQEAPYLAAPTPPTDPNSLVKVTTQNAALEVYILPGIKQMNPADVMRGEETQVAGVLHLSPSFEGVICMPGTHSKWAEVKDSAVTGFTTFMSGELFALMRDHSVLQHSVSGSEWDWDAFDAAVKAGAEHPENFLSSLFAVRARDLLDPQGQGATNAALSGAILGAELKAARPYWLGREVALVGASQLTDIYAHALSLFDVTTRRFDADDVTLAGLSRAYQSLRNSQSESLN